MDFTDERGVRHKETLGTDDIDLAIQLFERRKKEIQAAAGGVSPANEPVSVDRFIDDYVKWGRVHGRSGKTKVEDVLRMDRRVLEIFFEWVNGKGVSRPCDVRREHLFDFAGLLLEPGARTKLEEVSRSNARTRGCERKQRTPPGDLSRQTASRIIKTVRAAFRWAFNLPKPIAENVVFPESQIAVRWTRNIKRLDEAQRDRLLVACAAPVRYEEFRVPEATIEEAKRRVAAGQKRRDIAKEMRIGRNTIRRILEPMPPRFYERRMPLYQIVAVAAFTGMRQSEILLMEWDRVHFDRGVFHVVKTKTGVERDVPIFPPLDTLLGELHEAAGRPSSGYVFRTASGTPYGRHAVWKALCDVLESLTGFPHTRKPFLLLRHTFATILVSKGESIFHVSKWLGHASVATTENHHAAFAPQQDVIAQAAARMAPTMPLPRMVPKFASDGLSGLVRLLSQSDST